MQTYALRLYKQVCCQPHKKRHNTGFFHGVAIIALQAVSELIRTNGMKQVLMLSFVLLTSTAALAAQAKTGGMHSSPAYKECTALSASDPAKALTKAEEWLKVDNSVPAQHCRAMALFGLRRYAEAGEALTMVRDAIAKDNFSLRSYVTHQAVQAWLSANRADAALATLGTQINEMNGARGDNAASATLTSKLMLERARLNLTYGKTRDALVDLDHAVSLTPINAELLITRAGAFEQLGDLPLARADAQGALVVQPTNEQAKHLLNRLDAASMPPEAP